MFGFLYSMLILVSTITDVLTALTSWSVLRVASCRWRPAPGAACRTTGSLCSPALLRTAASDAPTPGHVVGEEIHTWENIKLIKLTDNV